MSFTAMTWAASVKTQTPIQKLILLMLADRTGDNGICFPKMTTIAEDCCMSRSCVLENVKKLAALGFILVEKRTIEAEEGGRHNAPHIYRVCTDRAPLGFVRTRSPIVVQNDKGCSLERQGVVVQSDNKNLSIEPINEPCVETGVSPSPSKKAPKKKRKQFKAPSKEECLTWASVWAGKHGKDLVKVDAIAAEAWDYYERLDWHDSRGTMIKDWKRKIAGVWFTDEKMSKPVKKTPDLLFV